MENLSQGTPSFTAEEERQFVEFKKQKKIEEAAAKVEKIECDCLSPYVERTKLKTLCKEANGYAVGAIVVPPALVKLCVSFLGRDPKTALIAAISYPDGGDVTEIKCRAAKMAVKDGVDEVEVYAPCFAIKDGNFAYFKRECKKLKKAVKHRAVRVAFNVDVISSQELVKSCIIAADAGINCIRLCGGVDGELLQKIKSVVKDRCLFKFDGGENLISFDGALNDGASKVCCKNAIDLARLIVSEAKK
jgi:deoxyribose-phosphate aldolase